MIPSSVYWELPSVKNTDGWKYYTAALEDFSKTVGAEQIADVLFGTESFGSAVKDRAQNALQEYLIDDYIMSCFSSDADKNKRSDQFMKNEAEYIISGQSDEEKNTSAAYSKIAELRISLNIIHVLCDKEKMNTVKAAGTAVSSATYGIGSEVYTAVIIAGWAASEAVTDIAELKRGGTVPLIK